MGGPRGVGRGSKVLCARSKVPRGGTEAHNVQGHPTRVATARGSGRTFSADQVADVLLRPPTMHSLCREDADRLGRARAMEGFQIAEAQLHHLDELSLLFESYRQFYRQEADAESAKAFLHARLQRNDSVIYVAHADGQLAAFMQLYPLLDSLKLGNLWLLNDLYVDPSRRGQGIAKMMLSRAKQLARQTNATG